MNLRIAPPEVGAALAQPWPPQSAPARLVAGPFRHLDSDSLGNLFLASRLHRLDRGQGLYEEGETLSSFYWVETGSLKLVRSSALGKEMVVRFVGPGEFLGVLALPMVAVDGARALELTRVLQTPLSVLQRVLGAHPLVAWDLLELAQKTVLTVETTSAALGLDPVPSRLARALLRLTQEQSGRLRFPLSQAELAQFVGSSRETVCMTLNAWKREGVLSIVKGRLRVLDRGRLEKLG